MTQEEASTSALMLEDTCPPTYPVPVHLAPAGPTSAWERKLEVGKGFRHQAGARKGREVLLSPCHSTEACPSSSFPLFKTHGGPPAAMQKFLTWPSRGLSPKWKHLEQGGAGEQRRKICKWKQGSVWLLPRQGYLESFFQRVAEDRVRKGEGGLPGQASETVLERPMVGPVRPVSRPAPPGPECIPPMWGPSTTNP